MEAAEGVFTLALDVLHGLDDFAIFPPGHGALGEHVGLVGGLLESTGDDFFGVA